MTRDQRDLDQTNLSAILFFGTNVWDSSGSHSDLFIYLSRDAEHFPDIQFMCVDFHLTLESTNQCQLKILFTGFHLSFASANEKLFN